MRSRPRRTPAWRGLSASDQTIDLAGVNLQIKRGRLMPQDAGPMVSMLTADCRPVFAQRWMVRALDVGPHHQEPAGAASALHPPDRLLT